MSYPIYKLLRAVNRQYPNNGFINYVDVREDMYNHELIDEDLRDLINETIQEVYKDVAIDEVWSFPTVPGQNQYVLPEDCDLRDIQEVTRTFVGVRGPLRPPFPPPRPGPEQEKTITFEINPAFGSITGEQGRPAGEGTIIYFVTEGGTLIELPTVIPADGYEFLGWSLDGTTVISNEELLNTPITGDLLITGIFKEEDEVKAIKTIAFMGNNPITVSETPYDIELTELASAGTRPELLTIENGKIVIGAGVKYVKVSANVDIEPVSDGDRTIQIVNSVARVYPTTTIQTAHVTIPDIETLDTPLFTINIPMKLVRVEEGDVISLQGKDFETGDKLGILSTYLTVEVVEVEE